MVKITTRAIKRVPPAPKVRAPVVRVVQPALQVGAVSDPAEREAEAMASRVVASSAPAPVPVPESRPGRAALNRSTEDQPNLDDLATPSLPAEQAEVSVADNEDVETTDLKTEDTSELDGETPEDTSGEPPAEEAPPIDDAPFPVMEMRRAETGAVVGRSGGAAPADVADIVAAPGPGRALPRSVRQRIEPHFGTSFANVRLHDSPADRRAAARIGARAFTHKNRIWLGHGESEGNTRLMAHELTHVVQQTKGAETLPLAREPAVIRRGYFANKAESVARHLPGYTLLTVLVGRKLISGKKVSMNAENLLEGFLGLIPGGTVIFDRLKEARVIQEAFEFVKGKLGELNLTWDRIKSDISEALDTYNPFKAARNVKNMIVNIVRDIVRFVTALAKKLLEFIIRGALSLAGSLGDKVWGILQKAGDTINLILEDPLGFAKNLVRSIVGGFQQFSTRILEHLKAGLLGWLFGSLSSAGIEIPAKLDFKGLITLVLQLIGVTYANFRKRLVKKLGPKGEKMVSMMEKSVEVVKILLKEGFAGIWQKLLGIIDNFKSTLLGGMSTMVITSLVRAGVGWLAGLSNPIGAILKIVLAIYDLIVTFIERFDQIRDVAEGIFASIGSIARGQVAQAANFIEETIGRTVPVVIAFVAALIPISGITAKIRKVVNTLKKPVTKAMDKMITFVRKKAKKLFSKLIAKVNGKRKYPSANFKIGEKQHSIFATKTKAGKIEIQMASGTSEPIDDKEKKQEAELGIIAKAEGPAAKNALKIGKAIQGQTGDADDETAAEAKKIKANSKKENQLAKIKRLEAELLEAAKELTTAGAGIDTNPDISSQTDDMLFRAAEPRKVAIEGQQDTHKSLMARSKTEFNAHIPDEVSSFYEMDHTIEKRFAKAVLENLHLLDPEKAKERLNEKVVDTEERADRAAAYNENLAARKAKGEKGTGQAAGKKTAVSNEDVPPLGKIGTGEFAKIPDTAPLFPAVAMYRHNHVVNKGMKSTAGMIESARNSDDPHGEVKKTLSAQIDLELAQMTEAMANDTNATPQLRNNVQEGIEKARTATAEIFGLEEVTPRDVKKEEVDPDASGDSASVLAFDADINGLKFGADEGAGGNFGGLKGSKHFERDHIIDQAYPKHAKGLSLLGKAEKSELAAEVKKQLAGPGKRRNMTKARKARLNEVNTADMFGNQSPMKNFTEGNGYAIRIYTPLARRVTALSRGDGQTSDIDAATGSASIPDLAAYVIEGTGPGVEGVRNKKHSSISGVFQERSLKHSLHVANEYKAETVKAGSSQISDQAGINAAKAMSGIKTRVAQSLQEARNQTVALFG